ncbi:MAG: hypothetical protein DWQ47_02175 [Acidobacteria bacterium]|nr:MAG: hypothetical protein DWQ32_05725 [Acidobacteriota bacterium]REK01227.1 MAG: hypothetical protein DWQ38_02160 [Acidobacteriota bacterium]REK14183.1 MAG: hypothetical protein DWQ43_11415 [Acidobacteriota bacterium]REK44898.1 MAG: hypothetical protein DWQ47_02175 [Acidobacteriota bacterium]
MSIRGEIHTEQSGSLTTKIAKVHTKVTEKISAAFVFFVNTFVTFVVNFAFAVMNREEHFTTKRNEVTLRISDPNAKTTVHRSLSAVVVAGDKCR